MDTELYINTYDYQGDTFFLGILKTLKDWKKQALTWCEMDDATELYRYIKKHEINTELLDFINEVWSIELVKFDTTNKEHLELYKNCYNKEYR